MAIQIITDDVHWLTNSSDGTLNKNQGLIYLADKGLGMTHPGSGNGLTPSEAFKKRYAGQRSNMSTNFHGTVFVYESLNQDVDHDNKIRAIIHEKFLKNKINFDACHPKLNPAPAGVNTEALLDFNKARDFHTLYSIIQEYFNTNVINDVTPWVPRDAGTEYGQDLIVTEIISKLKNYDKVAVNGHTGLAKTMISSAVVHQYFTKGAFVLLTTPINDTLDDINDNFSGWFYPNDCLGSLARLRNTKVYTANDLKNLTVHDMRAEADAGSIVVLALTVQDARYQDVSQKGEVRDKYKALLNIEIDFWIRDEKHKEYAGSVTSKVFNFLKPAKILDLSASINKIRNEYSYDAIVDRGLFWALEHQEARGTPRVIIETLDGAVHESLSVSDRDRYDIEQGWLPSKMTEMREGILVSHRAFDSLFETQYINDEDKDDNPISICNDPDLPEVSKRVGLHVLPEGVNGMSARDYITRLATDLNDNPKWNTGKSVFVTPWNYLNWADAKRGIYTSKQVIEDLKTRYEFVIILTHRMWTTGSNIPQIGHVVLWDKMIDPYNLEQLFPGRAYRLYSGKSHIKLYVMHPGQHVTDTFCITARQTSGVRKGIPHPVQLLKNINFKKYTAGIGVKTIDAALVYESFNKRIKERINRNISSEEIMAAISGTIFETSLENLDLNNKMLGDTSDVDMTDDNGAKKKESNKQVNSVAGKRKINIAKSINAIMIEIPAFALLEKIINIKDALMQRQIVSMFGEDKINIVVNAVENCTPLRTLLQDKLTEYHQALGLLGFEEMHDYVFTNTSLKKKSGLVFIDMKSAKSFAEKTILHHGISTNYTGTIAVVNSLSGSVSFYLQKLLPNAKIVCVERFTYYNDHLRSSGFKVCNQEKLEEEYMAEIKYWFLNPPYQKDASGKNDDENKQGSFWYQFIDTALTTSASTDDAKYFVVSPKSMFGAGGFGSNTFKVNKIREHAEFKHIFPDISSYFPGIGIAITGYVIDKEKNNTTVTIEGYNETIEVDGVVPVPFEVTPTAKKVLDNCFTVPAKIFFKESIKHATDNDVVLKVNGGRFKLWKKVFVGYNKDTKNNQQGAILKESELLGYQSAIKSELWEYIFKILGGEKGNSITGFMKHLPIMEDMTRSYTNEEWYNAFNITKEMQIEIKEFLRKYK